MDLSHSENIILRHILESPTYLETCRKGFFKNESFGVIFEMAKEFWNKFHEMPTGDQLIEASKLSGNSRSEEHTSELQSH